MFLAKCRTVNMELWLKFVAEFARWAVKVPEVSMLSWSVVFMVDEMYAKDKGNFEV